MEQIDISEERSPPEQEPQKKAPHEKKDDHNYLPDAVEEPPKPKPAAVTENAMLLELQQRIDAAKKI